MTWKIIPFVLSLILGGMKLAELLMQEGWFNILAWSAFWAIWTWIFLAFWRNMDMPSYSGEFRFNNGKNEIKRTLYMLASSVAFLLVFFFG